MIEPYWPMTRCLACDGENLRPYFQMRSQPPANRLRKSLDEKLPAYPLGLMVCIDCWHSQNLGAVDPDILYANYPYLSGTSQSLRDYFASFVARVEREMLPGRGDKKLRVLDIAANDGTLLEMFRDRGHEVLGVDPAENLVEIAAEKGITVLPYTWEMLPHTKLGGDFDVIVAMNVLGHVRRPSLFLRLCNYALGPGGRLYIQTSQARMIERGEFDTVYHEHLSFFTAKSFDALVARCNMSLVGLEHVPVHGTSYLATIMRGFPISLGQHEMTVAETLARYYRVEAYDQFSWTATDRVTVVEHIIRTMRQRGFTIAGYGAAAKGITFLAGAGIQLEFIVDDNPLKLGRFLPAQDTEIVNFRRVHPKKPILWVILAWNMRDEIVAKIKAARPDARNAFLTCFPDVQFEDPEVSA